MHKAFLGIFGLIAENTRHQTVSHLDASWEEKVISKNLRLPSPMNPLHLQTSPVMAVSETEWCNFKKQRRRHTNQVAEEFNNLLRAHLGRCQLHAASSKQASFSPDGATFSILTTYPSRLYLKKDMISKKRGTLRYSKARRWWYENKLQRRKFLHFETQQGSHATNVLSRLKSDMLSESSRDRVKSCSTSHTTLYISVAVDITRNTEWAHVCPESPQRNFPIWKCLIDHPNKVNIMHCSPGSLLLVLMSFWTQ